MPRARKHGGSRVGKSGKAYPQRSDLNGSKVVAFPGQTYGVQAEQIRAQRAVPVGRSPTAQIPQSQSQAAPALPPNLGDFGRPTDLPEEDLFTGAAVGPGPGPEVLAMNQGPDLDMQDLMRFQKYLPTLELAASQPDASVATRNFIRQVRGLMPLNIRSDDPQIADLTALGDTS